MSTRLKVAEQEAIFIKHVNDIGITSYACTSEGIWSYFELRLKNKVRRYWKTRDADAFLSKLNIVGIEAINVE